MLGEKWTLIRKELAKMKEPNDKKFARIAKKYETTVQTIRHEWYTMNGFID